MKYVFFSLTGVALVYGCTSAKPTPAAGTPPANETLQADRVSSATLQGCAHFPGLVAVDTPCSWPAGAHPPSFDVCRDFAPASNLKLPVITVMVTHDVPAPRDIAMLYGFPTVDSMIAQGLIPDAGEQNAAVDAFLRKQEASTLVPLVSAPTRNITVSARGMMMGGTLEFGTLPSAHGRYVLAMVVDQVLHDYPLSKADFALLRDVDVAKTIECVDGAIFK